MANKKQRKQAKMKIKTVKKAPAAKAVVKKAATCAAKCCCATQKPATKAVTFTVHAEKGKAVYHVSSLDADSRTAEKFAEIVRTHWYVEVYHGKRDNGYHEDVLTRRCDESLMSAAMVARSFGMWICARRTEKTTEQVKRDLWEHPSKLVRIMLKGGLL